MHSGSFALGLFTARSQRSAKDKQTERVGAHRYVRERWERCRWQIQRPERVAAVCMQRSHIVGKAHTGHRNSGFAQ